MQNYTNSAQKPEKKVSLGIFGGSAGPSIYEQITSYNDDGTYADEFLKIFAVLLLISSFFTLAFGWALHFQIFEPYAGEIAAHITAALFTIFIEVSKIVIGYRVLKHFIFGFFLKTKTDFVLGIFSVLIFVGAFWWSYYNSTHGVQYATQVASEWRIDREKIDPTHQTAAIDTRIAETAATAKKGLGIKWKETTTRSGQRIAENATAAVAAQEQQKTILLEMAAKEQTRSDQKRDNFISGAGTLFSLLGGKCEFFQIFFLVGMVCCSKILNDRIKAKKNMSQTANHGQHPKNQPKPFHYFGQNGSTTGNYHPIGFNTDKNGNVKSVPQTQQPVAQTKNAAQVVGANEAFKLFLSRLKKDVTNFSNKHAKNETVANRLLSIIQEAAQFPAQPDFEILCDFIMYTECEVISAIKNAELGHMVPDDLLDWIKETYQYVWINMPDRLAHLKTA